MQDGAQLLLEIASAKGEDSEHVANDGVHVLGGDDKFAGAHTGVGQGKESAPIRRLEKRPSHRPAQRDNCRQAAMAKKA